jgi:hypothetical protein
MATVKGRAEVRSFIARLPAEIETKVLRGAARAGGKVVLEEAKDRANSEEVKEGLVMKTRREVGRVIVKVTVKGGWARSLANWAEYGTAPHFITVDDSQRRGMSVKRVNDQEKKGSLIIGGHFVGRTVHHPGARAHPFLRPALDVKGAEAIAAAQSYINSRVRPSGIVASAEPEDDDA